MPVWGAANLKPRSGTLDRCNGCLRTNKNNEPDSSARVHHSTGGQAGCFRAREGGGLTRGGGGAAAKKGVSKIKKRKISKKRRILG